MLTLVVAEYNDFTNIFNNDLEKASLALIFTCVGVAWISWLALVFKCPACKANVGRFVITKVNVGSWFPTLLTIKSCPNCKINDPDRGKRNG